MAKEKRMWWFPLSARFAVVALIVASDSLGQLPSLQRGSSEWVVDQFFVQSSFPDMALYVDGEAKEMFADGSSFGSSLPAGVIVTMRLLKIDSSKAVYSVFARDSTGEVDLYAHLNHLEGVWKLTAVRGLALPPLYQMFMDSLSKVSTPSDSMRAKLLNMRLTTASDSALRVYFMTNREALNHLAAEFASDTLHSLMAAAGGFADSVSKSEDLASQLAVLHFNGIHRHELYPGCLFVEIGGMLDNEVGFLFVPDGSEAPEMSAGQFICIDPLGDGWYLYKTT